MVALQHVTKRFGHHTVVADLSLSVAAGDMVCLYGPSGCGKTTVLNLVAGILRPDAGSIRVETDRIGFAFQDDRLIPWLTARDNLLFALSRDWTPAGARQRADDWLDRLGLHAAADRKPAALSGGMRRRVNLARSLAVDPDLLLLDEPFTFLDPDAVAQARDALRYVHAERNTAVLVVSHVLDHVRPLEPRTVRMPPAGQAAPDPNEQQEPSAP